MAYHHFMYLSALAITEELGIRISLLNILYLLFEKRRQSLITGEPQIMYCLFK